MVLTGTWTIARVFRKKAGNVTVIEEGSSLVITAASVITFKPDQALNNYQLANNLNPHDNDAFEGADTNYEIKGNKANGTDDTIVGYIKKLSNNDEDAFIGFKNIAQTLNPSINANRYRLYRRLREGSGVVATDAHLIVKTFPCGTTTTKVFVLVTRTGKPIVLTTTDSGAEVTLATSEYSKFSMKIRAIDRQAGSDYILVGYLSWAGGVALSKGNGGAGTDDGDAFVAVRTGSG